MTLFSTRTRRFVAVGAFALATGAAAAAPAFVATSTSGSEVTAQPACLAWFGNKEDGKCLSYSNGQPIYAGTPDFGIWGPNAGNNPGIGVSTGPLLPGTTINQGIG